MQKTPTATVSAGPVTPTIAGPDKDMKDVYILSGLVFFLAVVVAAFWYYSQADEAAHSNSQRCSGFAGLQDPNRRCAGRCIGTCHSSSCSSADDQEHGHPT